MPLNAEDLKKWLELRRKRLKDGEDGKQTVNLPNGIQIHIHMPKQGEPQKLPLSADGKSLATRDAVAQYPS